MSNGALHQKGISLPAIAKNQDCDPQTQQQTMWANRT